MSRRNWLIIGYILGLTVLGLLAALLRNPLLPGLRREWSLQFVPTRIVLPADLPSVHAVSVLLCNRGTRGENVRLEACCGVTITGRPSKHVKPNDCVQIPLRIEVRSTGVYRGAVFVYVQGFQSPVAVLPIAAQAYESAIAHTGTQRLLRLPSLVRKTPDVASEDVCVAVTPRPGFVLEDAVSPTDWLAVRLRRRGTTVNLCTKALPSAPEGQFILDLPLLYRSGMRSGYDYLRISGEVISSAHAEPGQLFFGVVSLREKQHTVKKAQLIFRSGSGQSLSVRATSLDFRARVERAYQGVYVIEVRFIPSQPGEIRGHIECRQGKNLVYRLPVSAIVQP